MSEIQGELIYEKNQEIDRLRADLTALRAKLEGAEAEIVRLNGQIVAAAIAGNLRMAEVERLRGEVERKQEQLLYWGGIVRAQKRELGECHAYLDRIVAVVNEHAVARRGEGE